MKRSRGDDGGASKRSKRAHSSSSRTTTSQMKAMPPPAPKPSRPRSVRMKETAGLLPAGGDAAPRKEEKTALQRRLRSKAAASSSKASPTPLSPSQVDIHAASVEGTPKFPVHVASLSPSGRPRRSSSKSRGWYVNQVVDRLQLKSQPLEMTSGNTAPEVFLVLALLLPMVCWAASFFVGESGTGGSFAGHVLAVAAIAFAFHGAGFAVGALLGTAKHFDLVGELSFFAALFWSFFCYDPTSDSAQALLAFPPAVRADWLASATELPPPRKHLAAALSFVWALRLGTFLVRRIAVRGSDWRFDAIAKPGALWYAAFCWSCQAAWVVLQGACVWALNEATTKEGSELTPRGGERLGLLDWIGLAVAAHGLLLEHAADVQKSAHNAKIPSGKHRAWLAKGLWAISRHPNCECRRILAFLFFFSFFFFTSSHSLPLTNPPTPSDFGEHLVWCGLALVCAGADPTNPWHLAKCLVSPLWSVVFLTFTSLMLLEKRMDRAFAGKKADKKLRRKYADYKAAVPVLVPEVFPYAYVFNYGAPTP